MYFDRVLAIMMTSFQRPRKPCIKTFCTIRLTKPTRVIGSENHYRGELAIQVLSAVNESLRGTA